MSLSVEHSPVPLTNILNEQNQFQALPEVSLNILNIVLNPNSDAEKLEKCIRLDEGLSTRCLRLANASVFAGRGKIETLRDAIVRIG